MAENYVLLETIQLTQSAASVTFDNIPQTGYTDLKIVMSVRTTRASTDDLINVNFNGVSTNQSSRWLQGNGTSATSGIYGSNLYLAWVNAASNTANTFGNAEMYLPNYTSANYKSVSTDGVFENNAAGALIGLTAGLWSSIAAITSVTFTSVFGANFVADSTFSLYGIAALGTTPTVAPKATGGNIVANDGTYWYHAFLTSGTFTPQAALNCNVLVVGGGGGAGADASSGQGAGGGAGGVFYATSQSLTPTQYNVVVGAGGAGKAPNSGSRGDNGTSSAFGSLTAAIGGGGGGPGNSALGGAAGGSGGGGGGGATSGAGASSTQTSTGGTGYGNSGGGGAGNSAGGGGGAGAAGGVASGSVGGTGGIGLNTWSTWASATTTGDSGYFASGGNGWATAASRPLGGGGPSSGSVSAASGYANTGGGGGGYVGQGGSGIVIVRYAMA